MSLRVQNQSSPIAEVPELTLWHFLLWLMRRRSRFHVVNRSMLPSLKPNDEVLINPWAYERGSLPEVGDRVVALHPLQSNLKMIKRVEAVRASECFLVGDNPDESSDSRSFGWVQNHLLQGKVVCRFG